MAASVNDIIGEISERLGDVELERTTKEQVIELLNAAARDLRGMNVVIPLQDDESTTIATATYEYAVPGSFAWVHDIFEETGVGTGNYFNWVPWQRWRLKQGGANVPTLWFDDQLFTINAGRRVRILGHARPTDAYVIGTANIDEGLEAFIRERATSMAARQLSQPAEGAVQSALENLAATTWQNSEELLRAIMVHENYRPRRYSRAVSVR